MENMIRYHGIALLAGYILDLLIGDPHTLPHPVRLMGHVIQTLEGALYSEEKEPKSLRRRGSVLVILVLTATVLISALVLFLAYRIHFLVGLLVESILTCYLLAAKCLKVESGRVYQALKEQELLKARAALSMIVGRDTDSLTKEGVARAAIETVAENTSDGVIAPLLCTALLGPVFGFFYKAVNTMDSMLGYKNKRYLDFGRAAARLDDVMNFLPSRISAILMILATLFLGKRASTKMAVTIFKRDRFRHASPNSAQTESVMAGALQIRLAGPAFYFGELLEKPVIGDDIRPVEAEDILLANTLMLITEAICLLFCELLIQASLILY